MKVSEKQAAEYIHRRLNSRRWRIENLYWLINERGQKVKFKLNLVQKQFFKEMWWRNVILKSRQHGMSTLINLLELDECLFNPDHTCGIVDKTDVDAKKKLDRIRYAYDHLDDPDDPRTATLGAAIKQAVTLDKRNDHELEWSNNSKIWCGTSLRGGTVQFLHISELGPIAHNNPKKAEEIRSGALNTVHEGAKVVIESTHEGGKYGLNYEMVTIAQQAGDDLTDLDWKFHFYAWHQDPKNSRAIPPRGLALAKEETDYFEAMEAQGIALTDEQKHWYSKTLLTQKHKMWKEHPSTPEEAISALVEGAIYGPIISRIRREGRIRNFVHDQTAPMFTFWDLGQSDYTVIWLVQMVGPEFSILNHFAWRGEGARFYAAKMEEWEDHYGKIQSHYLPHDAANVVGPGVSWQQMLIEAGLPRERIKIVPRTPDVWIGINHLRNLLPRCWIHLENCSREMQCGDELVPSGIAALEGYHTKTSETGGIIAENPVHDNTSHACDALRTMSEAHLRGMLAGNSLLARESRNKPANVVTGLRDKPTRTRVRVRT